MIYLAQFTLQMGLVASGLDWLASGALSISVTFLYFAFSDAIKKGNR